MMVDTEQPLETKDDHDIPQEIRDVIEAFNQVVKKNGVKGILVYSSDKVSAKSIGNIKDSAIREDDVGKTIESTILKKLEECQNDKGNDADLEDSPVFKRKKRKQSTQVVTKEEKQGKRLKLSAIFEDSENESEKEDKHQDVSKAGENLDTTNDTIPNTPEKVTLKKGKTTESDTDTDINSLPSLPSQPLRRSTRFGGMYSSFREESKTLPNKKPGKHKAKQNAKGFLDDTSESQNVEINKERVVKFYGHLQDFIDDNLNKEEDILYLYDVLNYFDKEVKNTPYSKYEIFKCLSHLNRSKVLVWKRGMTRVYLKMSDSE
jgi:hypothetical protein